MNDDYLADISGVIDDANEKGTIEKLGVQWLASAHMTYIEMSKRWAFPFMFVINWYVRWSYQIRQFRKETPEKDSWAYKFACVKFDVQMFWDRFVVARQDAFKKESEEDLLQEKKE